MLCWKRGRDGAGTRLATLDNDLAVKLWDANSGKMLYAFPGPAVLDGANLWFSADGRWLLIADCQGTVTVRVAKTAALVRRFASGATCILDVAMSPDGKLIAASNNQRETHILDFESGQELLILPGGFTIQFSPDGTRLVVAGQESSPTGGHTVGVYFLHLNDLVELAKARVTRTLTLEECKQYLPSETCPIPQ